MDGLAHVSKKKRGKGKKAGVHARSYEAARSTPERRLPRGIGASQDNNAESALENLRGWARYLDDNHDLASGVLDDAVKNICGSGIVAIPQPLRTDGSIDEQLGLELMQFWRRWIRRADTTGELSFGELQNVGCRSWLRDGEVFFQHVAGRQVAYPFTARDVPYRLEMLESDFCPRYLTNDADGWRQGVRHNSWRMPTEYAFYLRHPGDLWDGAGTAVTFDQVKTVPAANVTHLKLAKRWPATRGISLLTPIVQRLYDIKDLEESERLKNRVLASWVAAITKSPDMIGQESTDDRGDRFYEAFGGTLIDTLAPGESIEGVGPDYPTANLPEHIADQIRRVASGSGTRYSSISKRYDGNYAAQRQEMVESEGVYQIREDAFVQKFVRTVYERAVAVAILDGQVALRDSNEDALERAVNAEYRGQPTPWIDPLKEVQADAMAIEKGFADIDQIRIKRGAPAAMIGTPAPAAREPAQLSLINGDEEDEDEAA